MTIGEVATASGVPATTLRYYEQVGLLAADARVGGKRRYRPSALTRLAAIRLCIETGFTLDEVRAVLADKTRPRSAWRKIATRKIAELERRANEAMLAKELLEHALECPARDITDCPHYRDAVASRTGGR